MSYFIITMSGISLTFITLVCHYYIIFLMLYQLLYRIWNKIKYRARGISTNSVATNEAWIAGLRAEIRTWDFPNMNQECHKVDHDVLFGHGESMINNFFITLFRGGCSGSRSEVYTCRLNSRILELVQCRQVEYCILVAYIGRISYRVTETSRRSSYLIAVNKKTRRGYTTETLFSYYLRQETDA
jgi:hypothetical protein